MQKPTLLGHFPKYTRLLVNAGKSPLMIYFVITGHIILFLSSLLFFNFEQETNPAVTHYWDALWWSMSTITTVGYGEVVPMTGEGRIVGFFLMGAGIIFFVGSTAILVASIQASITRELAESETAEAEMLDRRLKKIESQLEQLLSRK